MTAISDAKVARVLAHIGGEGESGAFSISILFERKQHAAVAAYFEPESTDGYSNG